MEYIRKILKEQFGSDPNRITQNDPMFNQMARKPSNLGCLEFKYHDQQANIDNKVKEMTPLLNDLGVKFISVIKMSNILIITVNKTNAEEVKNICAKFGMTLLKETFSDSPSPYNALSNNAVPDMADTTDFGRNSSDGRGNYSGNVFGGSYTPDRLAGE